MAYKTKVQVRTRGNVYEPGSVLPDDISASDLEFLKAKKFVELVDISECAAITDTEGDKEDDLFDELDPGKFKTSDEIRKIRKKEDVYTYAASIGLDLGEDYKEKAMNELYDAVINYQDERTADE